MSLYARSVLVGALFAVPAGAGAAASAADGRSSLPPARTLSGAIEPTRTDAPPERFDRSSVLVRFKAGTSAALKAQGRGAVRGTVARRYRLVTDLEHLRLPPGLEAAEAADRLRRLPFVEYAHPDRVISVDALPNDEYFAEQWALHNTGQGSMFGVWLPGTADADIDGPEAWNVTTGTSAVVAILDTGIAWGHPDLDGNVWMNTDEIAANGIDDDANGYVDDVRGWDFATGDNNPNDGHGHGSHVAGTVAAEGNNAEGVTGIAWQGKVMAVKVIADDGFGLLSNAVAGLEYAVANGARISNNSWGYYEYPGEEDSHQALADAIAAAGLQGHLFVAAAGNDSLDTDLPGNTHYPSSFAMANIVSVAATDNTDTLAFFSNFGPTTVDLGAPGQDVFSTWKETCIFFCAYDYAWESGTSMASPHVAGVAALVQGRHPDWTYAQVRDRIFTTVRPLVTLQGITVTGGIVDAAAALAEPPAPPSAPSGLQAVAVAHDRIDLSWVDNSFDEDGFHVERSLDASSWAPVATVTADGYSDAGLSPDTTYHYRVRAFNASGESAYTPVVSATTLAAPPADVWVVASGERAVTGTVTGTYALTTADDGLAQSITERLVQRWGSRRVSVLEHRWTFDVGAGGSLAFFANASEDPASTEDDFKFQYWSGGTYHDLCVAGASCAAGAALPAGLTGTVRVRVIDTDRTPGNVQLDTVRIDSMAIRVRP